MYFMKNSFAVDSASFKQNKYTLGTYIPIVPPEFLKEHEKDTAAILIMAAAIRMRWQEL